MFAKAFQIASGFTRPVVILMRLQSGEVRCGVASFIILNQEGWIVTVAHILETQTRFVANSVKLDEYLKRRQAIEDDATSSPGKKKHMLKSLQVDPEWIVEHTYWWGADEAALTDVTVFREADLMIGRLEKFDPTQVAAFPVIKHPGTTLPGTSLLRCGYPFQQVQAIFEEDKGFIIHSDVSFPLFPIEGIYTRQLSLIEPLPSGEKITFIETSSPGLKGQSGGPVVDIQGRLWGIQSSTRHLDLGFDAQAKREGKSHIEYQFLNVGIGVDPTTLIMILNKIGVAHTVSED